MPNHMASPRNRRFRTAPVYFAWLAVLLILVLTACAGPAAASVENTAPAHKAQSAPALEEGVNLGAIKEYAAQHGAAMKESTADLAVTAQTYYDLLEEARTVSPDDAYAELWAEHPEETADLIDAAKQQWLAASAEYELNEGIVAGVPALAYYDVWIDAGPPASEAADEALEWELILPNGEVLQSPGNFFHNLLEPTLWGTHPDFTGLLVDLDGDGEIRTGEALPDADVLLASAQGIDDATAQMNAAIEAWDPTLEDAFTALVIMVPTMNEYFEQWKDSAYVAGTQSDEESFVAVSRLFDINGILNGLSVAYDSIAPQVVAYDEDQHAQIRADFDRLIAYVDDLYSQELAGVRFSGEEADLFGSEAQDLASSLAALIAQTASELDVELDLT
ncbi:MAG: EfeM/EfeO family lipoprotein [Caldilineaceae bacterium]